MSSVHSSTLVLLWVQTSTDEVKTGAQLEYLLLSSRCCKLDGTGGVPQGKRWYPDQEQRTCDRSEQARPRVRCSKNLCTTKPLQVVDGSKSFVLYIGTR